MVVLCPEVLQWLPFHWEQNLESMHWLHFYLTSLFTSLQPQWLPGPSTNLRHRGLRTFATVLLVRASFTWQSALCLLRCHFLRDAYMTMLIKNYNLLSKHSWFSWPIFLFLKVTYVLCNFKNYLCYLFSVSLECKPLKRQRFCSLIYPMTNLAYSRHTINTLFNEWTK